MMAVDIEVVDVEVVNIEVAGQQGSRE